VGAAAFRLQRRRDSSLGRQGKSAWYDHLPDLTDLAVAWDSRADPTLIPARRFPVFPQARNSVTCGSCLTEAADGP
jgi:hypothetical protein